MPSNLMRQPNFAALLILAWLAVASVLLLQHWPHTAETLFDTDDAMRLVELRAPYHRLSSGIVTAHRVLAEPPEQARDIAREANATYVLICGSRPPDGLAEPARSRSLWARLQAGTVPDWLEPLKTGPVFSVYRVVRP